MLITLISLAVFLTGLAVAHWFDSEEAGIFWAVPAGIVLATCLIFIFVAPISIKADLAEYHAFKDSLAAARVNSTSGPYLSVEMAAIQARVIEFNRSLARKQFWARSPWTNWFVSKRVFEMDPIK